MKNILRDQQSHEALAEIFQRHHRLSPVLPLYGDERWKKALSLPALSALKEKLVRRAQEECDLPLPELTDELYREFQAKGTRANFEGRYFERRRRLARAAFALLDSGDERDPAILKSFLEKLSAHLEEVSWALPAHVPDPSGRDPQVIDLFAAETANLMAELCTAFSACIPPDLQDRIRTRLREGIFRNYLSKTISWMNTTSNWNAVCHQGVLGAALTIEEDAELLAALWEKASKGLPCFLEGFGEDGACSEGPAYWEYGFGWFSMLNHQLEAASEGHYSLFEGDPLIAKVASYGPAMTLSNGKCVPFSDCNPNLVLRPTYLYYLGKRLKVESCLDLARRNYARLYESEPDCDSERVDWFYLSRLFLWASEMAGDGASEKTSDYDHVCYYPSLGVWVSRGRDSGQYLWELAAKGGHNEEHHNHNDVGSFVVYVDGIPLITEIGKPEYTKAFFSPVRYSFVAARSLGHSLPVIHHCEQAAGRAHQGKILHVDMEGENRCFEIDLTSAYPPGAHCARYVRKLQWASTEGKLCVREHIQLKRPGPISCGYITDSESRVTIHSPTLAEITKGHLTLKLQVRGAGVWQGVDLLSDYASDTTPRASQRLVLGATSVTEFESSVEMYLG